MRIEIVGVYAVTEADCHLIEVKILDHVGPIRIGDFTQQTLGLEKDSWQVAWDERILNSTGTEDIAGRFPRSIHVDGEARIVFYIHYLDFGMPLITPAGRITLPGASTYPTRLRFLQYEPPD